MNGAESGSPRRSGRRTTGLIEAEAPLLAFAVGPCQLGLDAACVEEICAAERPIPLPRAPRHIPGVIGLRGHVVPLLDLGEFLELPGRGDERRDYHRVVVVRVGPMQVGLLCHGVRGVVEVSQEERRRPEVLQGERLLEYTAAEVMLRDDDGATPLALLDAARLLEDARVAA